jgi:polyhydroxyalkanoate synthesis regulator phasin
MAQPKRSKGSAGGDESVEELREQLTSVRERLLHSITLTTDRLQDAADDAVRRGRMTRQDAEDLVAGLVSAGRSQTEAILADVDQLLGPQSKVGQARRKATAPAQRVVDRAKRAVSLSGSFPIKDYDDLTAAEITGRLADLAPADLRKVRDYEKRNANRKSVLAAVDKALG